MSRFPFHTAAALAALAVALLYGTPQAWPKGEVAMTVEIVQPER